MFDRVPSPWPFPESFDRWRTHQSVNGNASDIYAEPDEVTWPSLPSRPPPVGIEWELPQPRQRFFEEHGVGRCPPNFDISEPIEEGSLKEWVYLVLGDSVNRNMEYAGGSTKWSELARGMRFPMDGAAIGLKKQHIFENGEQRRYCPPIEDYFRPHSEDWRPPEGFFAPPGLCLPPWHRIREDKMRREELGEDESPEEPKEEAKPVPRGRRVDVRALIRNRRDAKRSGRMAAVNKAPGAGWRSAPSPKTPPSPRVPPGPNSRAREVGGWDGVWPETDDGWGLPSCAAQVLESTRGPSKLCRDAPHSRPFAPPSSTPHRPQVHPSAKPAPDDSMRKGDHRWPANTGQRPSGQTWKPRGSQGWNGLNQKARAPLTSKQQGAGDGNGWGRDGWKSHQANANGWGQDPWQAKNADRNGWGVQTWKPNEGGVNSWGKNTWEPPSKSGADRWTESGWAPKNTGAKNMRERTSKGFPKWQSARSGRGAPLKQSGTKNYYWY